MLILTATLAASSAAAAQEQKSAAECGPLKTRVEASIEGRAATPERALTVRLEPAARLRETLGGEGGEAPLRVCVEVRRPRPGAWKGLRVFLNAPGADESTPTSAPGYVGSVAFYGGDEGEAQSFMLNLGRTVRRLRQSGGLRSGEPLDVTLVPIPLGRAAAGAADGIRVTKVTIAAAQ